MKILGIVGSRRRRGNTATVVGEVLESAKNQGAETQLINLADYNVKPCTGCEWCSGKFECVIKDDFSEIVKLMDEADGIVIGSPTYWYNVTGDMKTFIDRFYSMIKFCETDRSIWVSRFENQGKFAVPVAICEQHEESMMGYTYDTLKRVMEDMSIRTVGGLKVLGLFEAHRAKEDKNLMKDSVISGEKLVNAIKLSRS